MRVCDLGCVAIGDGAVVIVVNIVDAIVGGVVAVGVMLLLLVFGVVLVVVGGVFLCFR